MPDIIVKPAEYGNQEKEKTAELLTSFNDKEINKNEFKKQLGIMFKHLPVYLIACMKYRFDPTRGKNGAVVFEVIHPDKITLDPSAEYIVKVDSKESNNLDDDEIKKILDTITPSYDSVSGPLIFL